ncbi:hypothetical protein AK812_SmicGene34783 [Symbiodinium microadriaticum]|uniref:Uncharacterized protein n=1 Tax=Symbiodinium microadriaticum TaxID=2951 RepID=A0A1Q9CN73_SYMMI|nr:hypothetical protein AK812_SmicGene34783 [Symbiodinium microadriaticum]
MSADRASSDQSSTAWPEIDTSSWQQTLASTAQERERIVASLHQELCLLEGLMSQTVATISACPQSLVGNGSPRSPMNAWVKSAYSGIVSPSVPPLIQPPSMGPESLQLPPRTRSASTPSLGKFQSASRSVGSFCQEARKGAMGAKATSQSKAKPEAVNELNHRQAATRAPARRRGSALPAWPNPNQRGPAEPVQTPPCPRPLVHL